MNQKRSAQEPQLRRSVPALAGWRQIAWLELALAILAAAISYWAIAFKAPRTLLLLFLASWLLTSAGMWIAARYVWHSVTTLPAKFEVITAEDRITEELNEFEFHQGWAAFDFSCWLRSTISDEIAEGRARGLEEKVQESVERITGYLYEEQLRKPVLSIPADGFDQKSSKKGV